jgi:hypothetical protein
MFDTITGEITYTNKHFTKSPIITLCFLQMLNKYYLLAH